MKPFLIPNTKRQTFLRAAGTLLALALLGYLLGQQGWVEIGAALGQIPAWRLGLAFGLMVVSRLAVTGRWHILLRSSGMAVTPGKSLRITFAGLFASNFLPTTVGGDVVRLAGAVQLELDAAVSAASLIVDRLVGMAGMAMAVPFGLSRFAGAAALPGEDPAHGLAGLAALPLGGLWKALWAKGAKFGQKLGQALSLWLHQPRDLFLALVFTWIHMLCLFGFLHQIFAGMNSALPFPLIAGLYSIVYFLTLMPFSINGYGLQELSMTFVFSSLGGATLSSALAAALLFRTAMMIASLPGALFVPGILAATKSGAETV